MEEDPFAFLIEHSKAPLSQEEELQFCPFARESEQFLDSDSQSTWMSSEPNGIIMESPPESDPLSGHDKFLTPPEHPPSNASDSDNLKSAPPSAQYELTVACGGDYEVAAVDLEVVSTGDLGIAGDFAAEVNLGFESEVGEVKLEGELCDCVIKDHEAEVVGSDFDMNGVLGAESVSKEVIETLELGGGIDFAMSTEETENVDTENIHLHSGETVVLCGDEETKFVDDMEVQSRVDLDIDQVCGAEGDLGLGMEAEQCDNIIHDTATKVVGCEEELKLGGLGVGMDCVGNKQHIENTDTDNILHSKEHAEEIKSSNENLLTHLDVAEKDPHEGDNFSKTKLLDRNVGDERGLNVLISGENELVDGEGDGSVRKYGNPSENCQDVNGIENGGHKEDVNLGRSGKRKVRVGKRKLRGSDNIKYDKPSDVVELERGKDGNHRGKDKSVSGELNIPLSKPENGHSSEVGQGSVKKGTISFLDIVTRASELLKKDVDPGPELDLWEVLKRKGVKFPRPHWWPPEGEEYK